MNGKPACRIYLIRHAETANAGPQVKEIQTLDFHQTDVDQQIIEKHGDDRDDEPYDGFWRDEPFLLLLYFAHFPYFLLIGLTGFLWNLWLLPPNGSEPVEKP